jgi:hypothetical protein
MTGAELIGASLFESPLLSKHGKRPGQLASDAQ